MRGWRRGEEGFGAHDVDTALGINELGDVDVAGNRDEGIVEGGASGEFLVVHVAAVHPWGSGVVAAGGLGWCDAHAAEEGMKRDVDSGGEVADHLFAIEGDEAGVTVGEVVGQEAAAG